MNLKMIINKNYEEVLFMRIKLRDNLFYIGVLIFSITLFCEHLFLGENNLTCFFKGFSCGLEIVGAFIIIRNNKSES